jgi:hypothetical protein
MTEVSERTPAQQTAAETIRQVTSQYSFERTDGRAEGIELFEKLYAWLEKRIELHKQHDNGDLLDATRDVEQRVTFGLDLLCRKWEKFDADGRTY